jgi:hypothetical protein
MPLTGTRADFTLLRWLPDTAMTQAALWSLFTATTSALCAALHAHDFIIPLTAPIMYMCDPVHPALPYKLFTTTTCRLSWHLRCQTTHTAVATPHGRLTYQLVLFSLQPASPVSTMRHYSHPPPSLSSYTAGSPPPLRSIPVRQPANSCNQGAPRQDTANAVLMSVAASRRPRMLCAQVIAECTQS